METKRKVYIFNSITQIANHLETAKINAKAREDCRIWDWYGKLAEYPEMLRRYIINGDPKYNDRVYTIEKEIRGFNGERKVITAHNGYMGQIPNVARYCSGLPDCMIDFRPKMIKGGKIITLVYSNVIDTSKTAEEVERVNIALCKAIIKLERQGYGVNLYLTMATRPIDSSSKVEVITFFKLKGSNEKLNIKKCGFPLLNPKWWEVPSLIAATTEGFAIRKWQSSFSYRIDTAAESEATKRFPGAKFITNSDLVKLGENEIFESLSK